MFKLGLIINPYAGLGGRVGLKGSDGVKIRNKAFSLGAIKSAELRAKTSFLQFKALFEDVKVFTVSGEMGENLCQELGLEYQSIYQPADPLRPSDASDTQQAVVAMHDEKLDLLLFVGGDGTARDVLQAASNQQTVLGIPAGVKIHSGVYAVSPEAAGRLAHELIQGKMLSLGSASVVDLDEDAFRHDRVQAKHYGYLSVPTSLEYVQAVKHGNQEIEELVYQDIAEEITDSFRDDIYYVIGSGTTCAFIMQQLKLPNTLLGSDIILKSKVFKSDATEKDLLALLNSGKKLQFVLTVIGGQGHILGRGNPQISPEVIQKTGWANFHVIASKTKLKGLAQGRLLVDTGDTALDHQLFGLKKITTGYRDQVLFPVGLVEK